MRVQIINPAPMMYLHMPWHTKKMMLAYIFGPLLTCPSSVMISVLFNSYISIPPNIMSEFQLQQPAHFGPNNQVYRVKSSSDIGSPLLRSSTAFHQKSISFITNATLHRGAFCPFPFRWIYYYASNKSTGKESGKAHLCALSSLPNY